MKERSSTLTEYYHVKPKKGRKGAEQRFWPAETPTREFGLKSTQLGSTPRVSIYVDLKRVSVDVNSHQRQR